MLPQHIVLLMMLLWLLLLLLVSLLLLLLLLLWFLLSGRHVFALHSESHRCDGLSAVLSAAPGALRART